MKQTNVTCVTYLPFWSWQTAAFKESHLIRLQSSLTGSKIPQPSADWEFSNNSNGNVSFCKECPSVREGVSTVKFPSQETEDVLLTPSKGLRTEHDFF